MDLAVRADQDSAIRVGLVADGDALHVRQEQANKSDVGVRDTIQRQKVTMEADAQVADRLPPSVCMTQLLLEGSKDTS